jgi:hypothetical protein
VFSGADKEGGGGGGGDVEDHLFAFVNYLEGNKVPRSDWARHGTTLLSGKALKAWSARATQAARLEQPLTWELFVDTLLTNFGRRDRALHARKALHSVKQLSTVHAYVQHFQSLVSQCDTPPTEPDLIRFFYDGLKDQIKMHCRFDPRNGAFWTSFDALLRHALLIDSHSSAAVRLQSASTGSAGRKRPATKQGGGGKRGGGRHGGNNTRQHHQQQHGERRQQQQQQQERRPEDPAKKAARLRKQADKLEARNAAAAAAAAAGPSEPKLHRQQSQDRQ